MNTALIRSWLPLGLGSLLVALGAAAPAGAAPTPVRCRIWINTDLTDQNVPMECTRPDRSTFVNVPADHYLYVTDILVKPRLTSQTTVAASVRVWRESGGPTGCDAGGTTVQGSSVTDQYLELADTSTEGQLKVSYQVPYLVLTENDCLAVYTSTPSGLVVELSGLLSTSSTFSLIRLPEPSARLLAGVPLLLLAARRRHTDA